MALLHADNGNLYGTGTAGRLRALEGVYVQFGDDGGAAAGSSPMSADPDPASNGKSVFSFPAGAGAGTDAYQRKLRKVLAASKTAVGMFARVWWASFAANVNSGPLIRFADSGNSANIYLQVSPIGSIIVWRGVFGTQLYESAVCLTASAWHHIEAFVEFDDTTGSVEVRVNGTTVVDLSGIDTVAGLANCQNVSVGNRASGTGSGGTVYWKDFVIWDTTGSVNNDFFGTCEVGPYMPNGDDTFTWAPSSGTTGWDLIDETNGPNDAGYIEADATPPAVSLFDIEDLPNDVTSVRGLVIYARAKKTDGGDAQIQAGINSNGTQGNGTDRAITTAFTYWLDVVELDPDTGVQFTRLGFNDALLTIDRTL